ncbi:hypothetical protein SAMN05661008_00579 [Alkalithermobacter thermoalcaliphilus JW-YL-7 = DSM 7308]|uniref:Uncharacterized protein n=1 Tax=Alkalithermobacter thermoalcaliphilus JW-YL-7 = DSM 7308 TaxID=1121328 RepID=A0A150FQ62_CLOPD|nr:hypothetical protein JWYL7_0818 [[Clostridium] paradoxum JW-YL-7 = DSM 7308]SHK62462.1 hypothetical protein SAMN05661008_00579 [[Clostridium] paradoxum JW-YL-7 = DSM 7308]
MKKHIPVQKLVRFKWGGTTYEWQEEAKEIHSQIQDLKEEEKPQDEIRKEIEYGCTKQYWN